MNKTNEDNLLLTKNDITKKGIVTEPLKDLSQELDQTIKGQFNETEKERRHFLRVDKKPTSE